MAQSTLQENWQFNKTVLERNSIMLDRQLGVDVKFAFEGKSKRFIGAHKYMLMSSSPVFWSMFNGGLAASMEDNITITDVEYEAFGVLLRFIYCEEVQLTGESVMPIMYASKKYMIPSLTTICSVFLEENLTAKNVCDIFDQALMFDEQTLVDQCLSIVQKDTKEVFAAKSFRNISHTILARVLHCEKLNASEVDIFKACIQWAEAKKHSQSTGSGTSIRDILGELLYAIRFPTMSADEFSDNVTPVGVLSADEELMCFRYICSTKHPKPACGKFLTQKRDGCIKQLFLALQGRRDVILQYNKRKQNQITSQMELQLDGNNWQHKRSKEPTVVYITGFRLLCNINDDISLSLYSDQEQVDSLDLFGSYDDVWQVSIPCQDCKTSDISLHVTEVQTENGYQYTDVFFENNAPVRLKTGSTLQLRVNIHNRTMNRHNMPVQPANLIEGGYGRGRTRNQQVYQPHGCMPLVPCVVYANGETSVTATNVSQGVVIGLFIRDGD